MADRDDGTAWPLRQSDWCILRTSPGRTLQLAESLSAAGHEAWTPAQIYDRRKPRSKATIEITAPIMPTFVFARANQLLSLVRIQKLPVSPHPAFSIFRHLGCVPFVRDGEIANLREIEAAGQRKRLKKSHRHVFPTGEKVAVAENSWTGLEGVVEGGDGKFALVCFGGSVSIKIATFLLRSEPIEASSSSVAE